MHYQISQKFYWICFICGLFAFLTSCKSIGPKQINLDRNRYNVVLQETQNEELLRNIVRMRYYEPISFLQVTGVTASYSYSPSLTVSPGITYTSGGGEPATTATTGTATGSTTYTDSPTISYAPIASSDFINQLLTPTQLGQLSYLIYGGVHDPDLIFKLVIESMNGIDNASTASDTKIQAPPNYEQYYKFLDLLKELNKKGAIRVVSAQLNGSPTIALRIIKTFQNDAGVKQLKRLLGVPLSVPNIIFSNNSNLQRGIVGVETRSVMSMMIYLSHAVQAPEADIKAGTISLYHLADGRPFDWAPLMKGLMTIYTSDADPGEVFVKAQVHGHWFYIKNTDFDSKLTFSFLNNVLILTAGGQMNPNVGSPILTIPTR